MSTTSLPKKMTLETGKKIVDYILNLYEDGTSDFVNRDTKAPILTSSAGNRCWKLN